MHVDGVPFCLEGQCKATTACPADKVVTGMMLDYTRETFVYAPGNVRVTLDYNVRTGLHCTDFLNPNCPTAPAGEPQEVKPRRRRGDRSRKPTQTAQPVSRQEKAEKADKNVEQTLTIRPKKPAAPKQDKPKVQVQPKAAAPADGAQKAEGGANKKPFHRRRRRSGGGKPQGGEK